MSQLQRQLQDNLSRQLQAAISRDSSSYSSSGTYSPQNYQTSLQHLTDELNRNVSRHLQEFSGSASYSASGNYDQAQIENLRSQLLSSLTRQLQQNLQQHFQSSSSSYGASSSSNYRPVRGSQNYLQGQYRSGGSVTIAGEDCDHGNVGYRMKRSPYTAYRSRSHSYYHGSTYSNHHAHSGIYEHPSSPQRPSEVQTGQELDNSEIAQQEGLGQEVEEVDNFSSQSLLPKPQKIQEDNGQQVIDEFGQLHEGQEEQAFDEGQQLVDEGFGDLQVGKQTQLEQTQQEEVGQEIENSYIFPAQSLMPKPQKIQENEGQQVVDEFEQLHVGQEEQAVDDSQQPVEEVFGNLHIGQQAQEGQQIDDGDLIQQEVEHPLAIQNLEIGQQGDNSGGNIGSSIYNQPQVNVQSQLPQAQLYAGVGQQTEEFDSLQVGQQEDIDVGQVPENSDLSELKPVLPVQFQSHTDQVSKKIFVSLELFILKFKRRLN